MDEQKPGQASPDYEVGYGKPPKATQFKPGQSGNRKGRPKGAKNFSTVLENELNSTVVVTEAGQRKKVTKKVVIAKQLVNKAAAGDIRATNMLLAEARAQETVMSTNLAQSIPAAFTSADQLTISSILTRLRQSDSLRGPVPAEPSTPNAQEIPANPAVDSDEPVSEPGAKE